MAVIAYLALPPTEAVCAAGARLTPTVEPLSDGVLMDWTGCGAVPDLARRLAKKLDALAEAGSAAPKGRPKEQPEGLPEDRIGGSFDYRLGVAPVRFVAEALARPAETGGFPAASANPGRPAAPLPVARGLYVPQPRLVDFVRDLPVARLPGVDADVKATLAALAVTVLGDLRGLRPDLLRDRIGPVADTLLAWSRGEDRRTVAPLYPPVRWRSRISGFELADALAGGDRRVFPLLDAACAPLLERMRETGGAAVQLTVQRGAEERTRTFSAPVADTARIARGLRELTRRLLTDLVDGDANLVDGGANLIDDDADLVVEIIPAAQPVERALGQQTLWSGARPRDVRRARLQTVLEGLRDRFGDGVGFTGPRAALVRYEAMRRLYEPGG